MLLYTDLWLSGFYFRLFHFPRLHLGFPAFLLSTFMNIFVRLVYEGSSTAAGPTAGAWARVTVCVEFCVPHFCKGFILVLQFRSHLPKQACWRTDYAQLSLGVNVCAHGALRWTGFPSRMYSHLTTRGPRTGSGSNVTLILITCFPSNSVSERAIPPPWVPNETLINPF